MTTFLISAASNAGFLLRSALMTSVIQGVTLLTALIFVVLNLGVDITYAYVNPKVRLG